MKSKHTFLKTGLLELEQYVQLCTIYGNLLSSSEQRFPSEKSSFFFYPDLYCQLLLYVRHVQKESFFIQKYLLLPTILQSPPHIFLQIQIEVY